MSERERSLGLIEITFINYVAVIVKQMQEKLVKPIIFITTETKNERLRPEIPKTNGLIKPETKKNLFIASNFEKKNKKKRL